ncbi:MAG: MerR family DNA-binding transcriptional regulator [Planctomycetota bacterium]|nr:MAG: MerR family DNA-binding transcriptional regulator [Planctomycetota bacterium]
MAADPDGRKAAGERDRPIGPPPRKLYKIGEVMQYSGLSRQTIHNYTTMELITEAERTPSGHRLYGEEVFERLRRITELKKTHTLGEIRELLLREQQQGEGGSEGER